MVGEDKTRISVTLSNEIMRKLKEDAFFEGRSVSNLINKIIEEHYKIKNEE